ncbi:Uncharacterized protein DAT39_005555 [Clarias magur]|uniref:Uncharacterized protein n=1 Tax=Clarias magur TaxID=1594786 RepID=A0A8J4ULV3_CLAMG|nr:Uncharacterized protein DAT39_005555 [Clarias magur]
MAIYHRTLITHKVKLFSVSRPQDNIKPLQDDSPTRPSGCTERGNSDLLWQECESGISLES